MGRSITLLSIAETILAIVAMIWLCISMGGLTALAISSIVAPILLLKSPDSVELGKSMFLKYIDPIYEKQKTKYYRFVFYRYSTALVDYLKILFLASFIRVYAAIRYLHIGFRYIPENWREVVLCTDVTNAPELVYGTGAIKKPPALNEYEGGSITLFSSIIFIILICIALPIIGFIQQNIFVQLPLLFHIFLGYPLGFLEMVLFVWVISIFINMFASTFIYVISYSYRWTLKSTAIIWAPLIYMSGGIYDKTLSITDKLQLIKDSRIWSFAYIYSLAIIVLIFSKVMVFDVWYSVESQHSSIAIFNAYTTPGQLHVWHIASLFNALLTVGFMWFFLDKTYLLVKEGRVDPVVVKKKLAFFLIVRGLVSYYTIVVGLYIAIDLVLKSRLPNFSGKVFPWKQRFSREHCLSIYCMPN